MRIAGVIHESIVDGPGVRFVIFAQGCPHHCKGCHNEGTWDFSGGVEMTTRALLKELHKSPSSIRGVTLSGGEPFSQPKEMAILAEKVHLLGLSVVTYTGYTYEELLEVAYTDQDVKQLLLETDILVDGRYEEAYKDISLRFRGSSNQRVINMNASRQANGIVLLATDTDKT